ncbi:MAG: phospholipid carrier-dependent glycosyltransferase [Bifidobacteriaceae bacterium]|nr:phospholipid carrier-dependent glycosyltransferase [Bifidobacteriaceae bacterium]
MTLLALLLRLWTLGTPHKLMFDETYYVKDAYSLLNHRVEMNWAEETNPKFEAGDFSGLLDTAAYVAHPPVGKWMIAFGMWLFGPESSFGWRFSAAIAGTLGVLLTILIGWRLFQSQALGLVAGLLMAVDGISLVMSRSGLLDVFLMFFALAALWLILKDRAVMDRRLEERMRWPVGHGRTGAPIYPSRRNGPGLGMRWYLVGAGVALGLACGVKWSGLYFLGVYGLLVVAWDAAARRRAGIKLWWWAACWRDGLKAFALMVPVALVTYLSSWWGWFSTDKGFNRNWAELHPGEGAGWLPPALRSLVDYHLQNWSFHTKLTSPHDYQSNPALWLLQARPTSFFYETAATCGASECSQAVTALGNPLIWWVGIAALGIVLYQAVVWADRRAWAIVCGYLAGYVPWLFFAQRTIFTFYTVAFVPFVTLALAYAAGVAIGPARPLRLPARTALGGALAAALTLLPGRSGGAAHSDHVLEGWDPGAPAPALPLGLPRQPRQLPVKVLVIGVIMALMLFVSAFFWPIWTAQSVPQPFWQMHMWLRSWV